MQQFRLDRPASITDTLRPLADQFCVSCRSFVSWGWIVTSSEPVATFPECSHRSFTSTFVVSAITSNLSDTSLPENPVVAGTTCVATAPAARDHDQGDLDGARFVREVHRRHSEPRHRASGARKLQLARPDLDLVAAFGIVARDLADNITRSVEPQAIGQNSPCKSRYGGDCFCSYAVVCWLTAMTSLLSRIIFIMSVMLRMSVETMSGDAATA